MLLFVTTPSTTVNRVKDFLSTIDKSNRHLRAEIIAYYWKLRAKNSTCSSGCGHNQTTAGSNTVDWTVESPDNLPPTITIPEYSDHGELASLLVIILVAALLGNGLVLGTLASNKSSWSNMDFSILSLALSDILVSTTCIPLILDQEINPEWTIGSLGCRTIPFFMQLAVTANMLTLCCLAADRYLAIVYPLQFNSLKSVKTTQVLIFLAWLISLAAATPSAFRYSVQTVCGQWEPDGMCHQDFTFSLCLRSSGEDSLLNNNAMKWTSFVMLFVCPTMIMGVAYGIIIQTLWIKATLGIVALSATALRNRYKRKAVKMLVCVVLLFILSWAPLKIWALVAEEEQLDLTLTTKTIELYLKCLAMSSTAYNPIIYAFMNQKFRANFKNFLYFRKRFVRVAPEILINNKPGNRCRDKNQIQLKGKNDQVEDGKECPMSNNNNNTSETPGVSPKTTSTKLTTGSCKQNDIIIWNSNVGQQDVDGGCRQEG